MIAPADKARVAAAFAELRLTESDFGPAFFREASLMRVPAGQDVMAVGDRAEAVPLLLSGQVRVYLLGESGREITLYRFMRGEGCVLTVDAVIRRQPFPANAHVEEASEMVLVPATVFDAWTARYADWRAFLFNAMSRRLGSLLQTLEDVAFRRMDKRVAALLLEREQKGNEVLLTHQEIANDLGSSREVISRVLEDFQQRGLLRLARGAIVITDRQRLKASAEV